jgi:NAD(P)-dependent dehydrogenase (short-subunit alcohol dehydrogenase family)
LLSVARSNLVFLPLLLEQGRGHVVNTSSASGLLAYGFDRLPCVASKHAVVGVSEALALYLGPKGIGVTCVCPSGVITNIVEQITVYGEATSPRAPQHPLVEPAVVGELVADAVTARTFLVVTAPDPRRAPGAGVGSRGVYAADDRGAAVVMRVGFVGLGSQGAPMARRSSTPAICSLTIPTEGDID